MKLGSCFAGIGGFELAARMAGIKTVWQIESDPYCKKINEKNFPEAKIYGRIEEVQPEWLEPVDIISGGFPCQPFSIAGKQKGKADDRYLWPEMRRIIRGIKPTWVIVENVRGLISQDDGVVFEQVCTDLEATRYEVQPFIVPACAVDAPHRRDRVWILAYCEKLDDRKHTTGESKGQIQQFGVSDQSRNVAYPNGSGREEFNMSTKPIGEGFDTGSDGTEREEWVLSEPPVCGTDDGIPNRLDRIRALGNAIVPQVAYQIFRAIKEVHRCQTKN